MDFFFNLWFHRFLLNHLALCLITSFVCPSSLISSDEHGAHEADDHDRKCFRKNSCTQGFVRGRLTDEAVLS